MAFMHAWVCVGVRASVREGQSFDGASSCTRSRMNLETMRATKGWGEGEGDWRPWLVEGKEGTEKKQTKQRCRTMASATIGKQIETLLWETVSDLWGWESPLNVLERAVLASFCWSPLQARKGAPRALPSFLRLFRATAEHWPAVFWNEKYVDFTGAQRIGFWSVFAVWSSTNESDSLGTLMLMSLMPRAWYYWTTQTLAHSFRCVSNIG